MWHISREMISIGKNRYKVLVTIVTLASILIVNAITIGTDGHIALARHYDNIQVFKNSHINVQTHTNQRQDCETTGGTSPISDSCTAASTNTISQGTPPVSTSPCTTTSHPTVLTLSLPIPVAEIVLVTGTLTDTCTGLGVAGATTLMIYNYSLS